MCTDCNNRADYVASMMMRFGNTNREFGCISWSRANNLETLNHSGFGVSSTGSDSSSL